MKLAFEQKESHVEGLEKHCVGRRGVYSLYSLCIRDLLYLEGGFKVSQERERRKSRRCHEPNQ